MKPKVRSPFVAYEGPSLLGDRDIVVIFTPDSSNPKTGDMVQAWVLLKDTAPHVAIREKTDDSICGSCTHRSTGVAGKTGRTCYVTISSGPIQVWEAYKRGRYPRLSAQRQLSGEHVRVTAYGDAAALPFGWWQRALRNVAGWTGYTHQWSTCDKRFARLLMASVESTAEADRAHKRGFRTYRARPVDGPLLRMNRLSDSHARSDEFVCPASDEGGHRTTCLNCQLCRGTSSPAKHVTIELHGLRFKRDRGDVAVARRDELRALRTTLEAGTTIDEAMTVGAAMRMYLSLRRVFKRRRPVRAWRLRSRGIGWGPRADRDAVKRVAFWLEPLEAEQRGQHETE